MPLMAEDISGERREGGEKGRKAAESMDTYSGRGGGWWRGRRKRGRRVGPVPRGQALRGSIWENLAGSPFD